MPDGSGLTLIYFIPRSNIVSKAVERKKSDKCRFLLLLCSLIWKCSQRQPPTILGVKVIVCLSTVRKIPPLNRFGQFQSLLCILKQRGRKCILLVRSHKCNQVDGMPLYCKILYNRFSKPLSRLP